MKLAIVAAYIMIELEGNGVPASFEQVEEYLKRKRPSISLQGSVADALRSFLSLVRSAGSFEALQQVWRQQIVERGFEVISS